jgi:hypothetical protein
LDGAIFIIGIMTNNFQSHYDPSRPTIGKIYRDLHLDNKPDLIQVGDMSNEIMKGLVEDINDGIKLKPFGDVPWFIMIHEKKDLQMKEAFLRRILHFKKRPYPEDDTTVFWHHPKKGETRFCWSLPHWSEMPNIINSKDLFDRNLVEEVIAWKTFNLERFGFIKDKMGNWEPNPKWKDKTMQTIKAN